MESTNYMPMITTVLAIASAIGPVIFGFAIFKMSQIFVSRSQFDDFKKDRQMDMDELKNRFSNMEDDIKELLRR